MKVSIVRDVSVGAVLVAVDTVCYTENLFSRVSQNKCRKVYRERMVWWCPVVRLVACSFS